MGRPSLPVTTLHGHTIEELNNLKNTTDSKYTRLALTAVTMRYSGYSNTQIIEATGLSKVTIIEHVKNWSDFGLKSVEDHRGGKKPLKLSPDIVDDLLFVVLHKTSKDYGFVGCTWTLSLLASYIKQNYDIDVSEVTVRSVLITNNFSYKRAQPKPTKADKAEQEDFKKNYGNDRFFRVFI